MLDGRSVPVLTGPSRGNRIVVGFGDHAYWVGSFDRWTQAFIAGNLAGGDVFYDLGAHVGFFTLLGAKLVGASGKVISVEPEPSNAGRLRAHIRINHYQDRVRVIEAAASDRTGRARFKMHEKTPMGRLDEFGDSVVATVALDELELVPPTLVKMDIQGAEPKALLGMRNLILSGKPTMVISTHDTDQACVSLLEGWGYAVKSQPGDLIAWPRDRPAPLDGLQS
jgi:FkbM family methyltransferase